MKPFEDVPVSYTDTIFGSEYSDIMFKELWNDLDWVRHDKVPRREYYTSALGHDYTYGQAAYARTYRSQPMHPTITYMIGILNELLHRPSTGDKFQYDTVFLNGYDNGSDHLGWHADDSPEMDDSYPIAIISLGAEREIWFRQKPGATFYPYDVLPKVSKLKLGNGSLCIMNAGMQDTHQHRIPKSDIQNCEPRISLTFRMYTDPTEEVNNAT